MAADAYLCEGKYADAAAIYAARLRDERGAVETRLAAWGGLLDCDPAAGLAGADTACGLLAALTPAARPPLVRWCGWRLSRVVIREIPPDPSALRFPSRMNYRSLQEIRPGV